MKSFYAIGCVLLLASCVTPQEQLSYPVAHDATPYLYSGCVWEDKEIPIKTQGRNYVVTFKAQRCKDRYLQATYETDGNELRERRLFNTEEGPQEVATTFLYVWPYDAGTFKYKIAALNRDSLKRGERGRCHVVYESASDTYTYEPKAEYMKEMMALDEPFAACGDYGFNNDKSSYFGVLDNKLLVFFDISQEAPLYDPNSFHVK